MTTCNLETVIQRAREAHADAHPWIITDNGRQFIAQDFKEFIRIAAMMRVRTSPYYPQSNGRSTSVIKTLKVTTIRPKTPGTLKEGRQLVAALVEYYNHRRPHSVIGFNTPADMLVAGGRVDLGGARSEVCHGTRPCRTALQGISDGLSQQHAVPRSALDHVTGVTSRLNQDNLRVHG